MVVVNTHLYTTALAVGGELLPPHDLVVFDEAHELEDIASGAFGFEIGAGRLQALARSTRPLLDDPSAAVAVDEAALLINETLRVHLGAALPRPLDETTQERLGLTRERVNASHGGPPPGHQDRRGGGQARRGDGWRPTERDRRRRGPGTSGPSRPPPTCSATSTRCSELSETDRWPGSRDPTTRPCCGWPRWTWGRRSGNGCGPGRTPRPPC